MDHDHEIRTALDSLPFTAPEMRTPVLRRLIQAVHGLLLENGWKVDGTIIDLPNGVTPEQAQSAVNAIVAPVPRVATMDRLTLIAVASESARAAGLDPDGSWIMLVDTPNGMKRVSRKERNGSFSVSIEPA